MEALSLIMPLMLLVLLFGAGILYFRTKIWPTAVFFFGLVLATLLPAMSIPLWTGNYPTVYLVVLNVVTGLAAISSSIGFLLYAVSLPKKNKASIHQDV